MSSIDGATYGQLTGEIKSKCREDSINRFNNTTNPKILLLSLLVGGMGFNLTGVNHLIFVGVSWDRQLEEAVVNKVSQMEQKKNVYIYKFLCRDTVEIKINDLLKKFATSNPAHDIADNRGSTSARTERPPAFFYIYSYSSSSRVSIPYE